MPGNSYRPALGGGDDDTAMVGAWDPVTATAGGAQFGVALETLVRERGLAGAAVARGAQLAPAAFAALVAGDARATIGELARIATVLKLRALAFLQQAGILSLETYAAGLDPLFFLPLGTVRHDARIYMREINPRHAVPERDMFVRNPVLAALAADALLDPLGRLELELAYLLRTAALALTPSVPVSE